MKFTIEQYPKNKDFDFNKLSIEQQGLRLKSVEKKYEYGKTMKCKVCGKKQDIDEFYIKDKQTGRRNTRCRDCQMRAEGVIEIGKTRFSLKIANKGFRRCSVCKDIKPLSEYKKSKGKYLGISNNCYACSDKLHSEFVKTQQENIGTWYIEQYGKLKGITEFNDEVIEKLKMEILERRKNKYFVDGKGFVTIAEFARYIETEYGLPITMTKSRILEGKTEEECKLSEYEMRSLKSGTNQGQIKVTDCETGEVFIFKNTKDKKLLKMFSRDTITKYLKSGEIVIRKREQKKGQSKV